MSSMCVLIGLSGEVCSRVLVVVLGIVVLVGFVE